MTRIQRARALRLGFILPLLLWASSAAALPKDSPTTGTDDALRACWASGPASPEHLGPCLGMSPAESGAKPVKGVSRARAARCDAKASLDYALAELIDREWGGAEDQDRTPAEAAKLAARHLPDPDAAWEDSYAACVGAP